MTSMRSDDSKNCNSIPIEHAYHLHIDQTVAKSKKSGNCGKENLTCRLCGHQWSKLREEQDAEAQDTEAAACDRESSRALLRKALKKSVSLSQSHLHHQVHLATRLKALQGPENSVVFSQKVR